MVYRGDMPGTRAEKIAALRQILNERIFRAEFSDLANGLTDDTVLALVREIFHRYSPEDVSEFEAGLANPEPSRTAWDHLLEG